MDDSLGFLEEVILKIIGNFPSNNFDFSSYVENLHSFLGNLNYFIPFYLFSDIFSVWLAMVNLLIIGLIILKLYFTFFK